MSGVVVIIPAAGSGTRFGSEIPKQFLPLAGKPVVQRVIERFLFDAAVDRVVVAVAEPLLAVVRQTGSDRVHFVAGGTTRLQSVARAVDAAGESEVFAVHDAVRPFFSPEVFHAVIDAARASGAALPVVPVADTIHRIAAGRIAATPDRSDLFAAQTPQCFRPEVLRSVLERAAAEGHDATDEAGLAAKYGHEVVAIAGDSLNFKITRPEDMAMAERVIAEWGEAES